MVLLRFAPSPTGPLHLGGLRTALFNHIYARKLGGKWILRIEDTDAARSVPGSVDGIRQSLDWAGLESDYGPGRGGPHAPYFQSERRDLYLFYAKKLLDSGHAYRCFCTPDRLAETRDALKKKFFNATYDKACLHLSDEEAARRVKAGEKYVVRLNDGKIPPRPTQQPDMIFGNVKDAHLSLPTDPVLLKSDSFPTYHLASVVDDHEMGITHVLRGEEWLPSLPLHLDLYACLSVPPPLYAHLPILLNPDGSKMSKRHGDVQVADYIKKGWEPDAVLNWLALSGWGASFTPKGGPVGQVPSTNEVLTMEDLISKFDLSALTHRRTILEPGKLEVLNKRHLTRKAESTAGLAYLVARAKGVILDRFPEAEMHEYDFTTIIRSLEREGRLVNMLEISPLLSFLFQEPDLTTEVARSMQTSVPEDKYAGILRSALEALKPEQPLNWDHDSIAAIIDPIRGKGAKTVLRHALTGEKVGLGLVTMVQLLGHERTERRLQRALDYATY